MCIFFNDLYSFVFLNSTRLGFKFKNTKNKNYKIKLSSKIMISWKECSIIWTENKHKFIIHKVQNKNTSNSWYWKSRAHRERDGVVRDDREWLSPSDWSRSRSPAARVFRAWTIRFRGRVIRFHTCPSSGRAYSNRAKGEIASREKSTASERWERVGACFWEWIL